MNPENYNKELTAFRDRVLGLLENNAAEPSGIMICMDRAVPELMAEYRKTVSSETFMLYLYPPCSHAKEISINSSVPAGEKTLVSSLDGKAYFMDKAGMLVSLLPGRKVSISVSAKLEGTFSAELSEIRKAVQNAISNAAQSSAARMVYLRDSIKNLPFILRDCNNRIKIMPENISAVICSAGPSMAESIPVLKKHAHGFLIIAVGRVVPSLAEAGIIPDFIIDVDANISWVKHHMKIDSVPVAAASILPNPDFEYSKALWAYGDSPVFNRIMKNMGLELNSIMLSKTVTVSALDFAVMAGIKTIAMTGSDLCVSASGNYHVNQETDKTYSRETLLETEGNNGGKVLSTPMLNSLRQALENYVFSAKEKCAGLKIFNCSPDGALIAQLDKKDFESFCAEFASEHKKVEFIENRPAENGMDIVPLGNTLSEYVSVTGELLEISAGLEREIRNSAAGPDKIRSLQKNLKEAGEKELRIRISKPFSILVSAVEEQVNDFINEMPRREKGLPTDALAQIRDFRERYILIHDLFCDLKNDFDDVIEEIKKVPGHLPGNYYSRDFSAFRNYAVSFIRKRNSELADFLSEYKAEGIKAKYHILPNLQNLPSVALIRNDGTEICLNDFFIREGSAAKEVEKFIKNTKFSPSENLAVFFAPGNWMHAAAFAEKFPDADIIVVEIWLDLFYHIIGQSMFFNKFPEKALVVGIHEKLKDSGRILMKAIGESDKKPLFFEDPATWKLEEVKELFKKTFDGLLNGQ